MRKLFVLGNADVFKRQLHVLRSSGKITLQDALSITMNTAFIGREGVEKARGYEQTTLWVNCDDTQRLEQERLQLTTRFGPASNIEAAVMAMLEPET